ncbi:MAG: alpha/beta fold hydrolase [Gammaproteobacteria bacterium]|nr:alpha/beta fold hydrolase [Gammaproteobacteria bacterium]
MRAVLNDSVSRLATGLSTAPSLQGTNRIEAVRVLLSILGIALALYIGVLGLLWLLQAKLVYFPEQPGRTLEATPADIGLPYEEVWLTHDSGDRVHGWFVDAGSPATLLYLHGNAGNISHRLDLLRLFYEMGISVMIIDYRGYGRSDGAPSELNTYHDALLGWHYLVNERDRDPQQLVIFGRSLGGAVAAWLAEQVTPGALVLESTFASIPDMARVHYPWVPAALSRIRYDTLSRIDSIDCPILIMHSREDRDIPFSQAEQLLAAAGDNATPVEVQGGHNTTHIESGPGYTAALREFFSKAAITGVY